MTFKPTGLKYNQKTYENAAWFCVYKKQERSVIWEDVFLLVFLKYEKNFVKIYLFSKAKRMPTLDSIQAISLEELRSDWSKELHEFVVLSILKNPQWNCY